MKKYAFQALIAISMLAAGMEASAQRKALDKLGLPVSTKLEVAYSLRQLSSAATRAIEVRRSDDQALDIGFDAHGDLDTKALTDFVGTGDGFVSKWYDQSGSNIHAVQEDKNAQPQIAEDGKVFMENGRPIIYTSASKYLVYSGMTRFKGIVLASRFSVCMLRRGAAGGAIDGLDCNKMDFNVSPFSAGLQINSNQRIQNISISSGQRLMAISAIRMSDNTYLYVNGEVKGKSTAALDRFGSPISGYIGRQCDGAGTDGEYGELILYNTAVTEDVIAVIARNQFLYYIAGQVTKRNALDKLGLPLSPKLEVAYSLRQLSSAAAKAIEVRRSDNQVLDIGFDANGDLDTKALTDFVGTGDGFVSTWYDQSGNNIHAVQGDKNAQPQIAEDGKVFMENGRPIIYTSASKYLVYSGMTGFSGSTLASRLSVCMLRRGAPGGAIDGFENQKMDFIGASSLVSLQVNPFGRLVRNVEVGSSQQLMTVSAVRQPGNSALYINGELSGKNTDGLDPFGFPINGYIGRRGDGTGVDGEHSELILYSNVLPESDITAIARNQFQYYNIEVQTNPLNVYNYFGTPVKAAYSLRKMATAYTGSAIQVRRSSDNATADIGFDIITGNLKIDQLKDFVGTDDGFVSIWYDQSGIGRHKTQSLLANQPQIVSRGAVIMKNGKPALFFPPQSKAGLEGPAEDYLTRGDITICFNAWSNSNSAVPRRAIQGSGQHNWFVGPYENKNAYWAGDWNLLDSSNPWSQAGDLFIISQPASGPNTVYRNGKEIVKYRNETKTYPGSISISAAGFADEPFDGYMSELLEFNEKLPPEKIAKLQNGISAYLGIPCSNNNMSALVTTDKHLFSVFSLRLINSDYEGPLVRLATGASFYDVYPDDKSALSLDSPVSEAMSGYNAPVSGSTDNLLSSVITSSTNAGAAIWYDQSGESMDLKQPDDGYRPLIVKQGTIVTQAENGNAALAFSANAKTHLMGGEDCLNGYSDGYINTVYTPAEATAASDEQFLVSKPQSWHLATNISTANHGGYFSAYPEGTLNEKQRVIPFFNPTLEKNSRANILSVSFNKEGVVVYGNQTNVGRSRVGLPPIYGNSEKLQVGGTGAGASNKNSFEGLIQELVITRGLNQEERRTLETMQGIYYKTNTCNTWAGADENWNNDCNWSFGSKPSNTDKAHIPNGSAYWPKVSGAVPMPALIVVEPAAKVNLEGIFSGGLPKVDLLADEESTGMVVNKRGAPLGEVGIQTWFTAQKGFRLVSNPFKNTQSLSDNANKSGFALAVNNTDISTEKSAAPTALSTTASDAQYFTHNFWKGLVSGVTQEAVPYAIHYQGLAPASLSDMANGPTPFPYYGKGEMYSGSSVSINTANSTSQFTLAGNPFTAPVRTKALTQGAPYYIFDVTVSAISILRREESGMWVPRLPSDNAITPVLGVVAFKQAEASPAIAVPASAVIGDANLPAQQEEADYLQLDLEKDKEYRDRLFIKLDDAYSNAPSDKLDLEKLMNSEVSAYTTTPDKMKLAIDCRPKPTLPIPVYFSFNKEGFYSFRVRHNGLADASEIYLADKKLGKLTQLAEGTEYSFFVGNAENQTENRFEIFMKGVTAGISELPEKGKGTAVYPIPAKDEIIIISDREIEGVAIYDLSGRAVLTSGALGKEGKMSVSDLRQGLYVLRVQSKEGTEHLKIIKE